MAKLIKKSVDEKAFLAQPKQSVLERFFAWGLSKAPVATAFAAVMTWLGKALAEESDAWNTQMGKVTEAYSYAPRKIIILVGGVVLLVLLLLSIFKKLRWRWFFILLGILFCLVGAGFIADSLAY